MYRALHFPGDVTAALAPVTVTRSDGGRERTVPALLGSDEAGRPFEVLDVEVLRIDTSTLARPDTELVRSVVHLQPAEADTLRGHRSREYHHLEEDLGRIRRQAAVAHYWRPDLYPEPAAPLELAGGRARPITAGASA